jgi:putative ABC transport system substrate-binding protein
VACTGLRRAGQAISLSSRPANFPSMSAFGGKADMGWCTANVCFDPKRTLRGPLTSLDQIDTMPCPEPRGEAMRRREFISLIGGAAIAYPLAARAQQPARIRRVGMLMNLSESDVEAQRLITAFREGLTQLGWVDGRNLRMDYRWAGGDIGRIRAFAKELVELSPDIIVAYATPSVVALQQQTHSVPIVFLSVTDPVGQGLVASLAHPGGNITGFSVFEFSLGTKWMDALKQIVPGLRRVVTIFNPKTAPYYPLYLRAIEKAASSFAVEPLVIEVHDEADIERAIRTLAGEPDGGLIVMPDSFNMVHRRTIIALVNQHRLPAMYYFPFFCDGRWPDFLWT